MPINIERIHLPVPGMDRLQSEARGEGYKFIDRLVDDWSSGAVRFDQPGEILCGCLQENLIVAVGGLTRDPFVMADDVGRIRRVYVRPAWRGQGIGSLLVSTLINNARKSFVQVRLRAENPTAARLYERLGLKPITDAHATHALPFVL